MAEQLTERQKKWFASVQASLELDTGSVSSRSGMPARPA